MRLPFCRLAVAGAVLTTTAAYLARPYDPLRAHLTAETARLREHFDSVEVELQARHTDGYSAAQRAARRELIGWLREYRDTGRFPLNDRLPHPAPFFRDSRGTLCAMAWLIARSGRTDFVDRVAATRNNATIAELAGDPVLVAWLDSVGLSVEEAARIQPRYGPPPEERVGTTYAVVSVGLAAVSLTATGFNLFRPSRESGWVGLLAGSAQVVAGATQLEGTGDRRTVAVLNTAAGAVAMLAGVRGLLAGKPVGATPEEERRVTIVPLLDPGRGRAGLALSARF